MKGTQKKFEIHPSLKPELHLLQHVIEKGRYVSLFEDEKWSPLDTIPWIDKTLLREGYRFYQDYYPTYFLATLISILGSLTALRPFSTVIFRDLKTVPPQPDKYLRKFLLKARGTDNLFAALFESDEGRRQFHKIRKIHKLAVINHKPEENEKTLPEILQTSLEPWMGELAKAVKKDINNWLLTNSWKFDEEEEMTPFTWEFPQVPISQLDIVCVAFIFTGTAWRVPSLFGMDSREDPKIKGLLHMWAVICRMLGLQDEFNIYINPKQEELKEVLRIVVLTGFLNIDDTTVYLQNFIIEGAKTIIPVMQYRAILCMAVELVLESLESSETKICQDGGYPLVNIWASMNWRDKFCYHVTKGVLWILGVSSQLRKGVGKLAKWKLERIYEHAKNMPSV